MVVQVKARSIVDAIADDLRARLFDGQLTGGTALTEVSVATTYDVARPTAKAAIEKLVAEGLLVRGRHKIARVPELRPEDVRDIYETRRHLESVAVRYLAEQRLVPGESREANSEILDRIAESAQAIVEPDMRFHTALVDSLGSPRVSHMYESLVSEVKLCMSQVQGRKLLSSEAIQEEHAGILDLIEKGDAEGAIALLTTHLSRARERLVGALGAEAGPEAELPEA